MPAARAVPGWVITHDYEDEELGTLKAGKEAGCFLVRRQSLSSDRFCLLVRKDYRKRSDRTYNRPVSAGERRIRRDTYMESVAIRLESERRAVKAKNAVGHLVMEATWAQREYNALKRLWEAGASVPYPVERSDHGFVMQYIGTPSAGAPRLADVKLSREEARAVFDRLTDQLGIFAREGIVHCDLSAYNVLLQHGRPWIIDVPQVMELDTSQGPALFERDVANICAYFRKYGVHEDSDTLTRMLLSRPR
ncbi:MAG: RIO1 family regulatory kinase/ATPase [Actinomycetota bacterium]